MAEPKTPTIDAAAATEPPPIPAARTEPVVIREQDQLMPIANVVRIMRGVLPPHAKIADDAKEVVQECVSEFISFITGEANDWCRGEHRKTVTAEDILSAMDRLGFDDYVSPLRAYVRRMRECEGRGGGSGGAHQTRAAHHGRGGSVPMIQGLQTHTQPAAFISCTAALSHRYGVVAPPLYQDSRSAAPYSGVARRVVLGDEPSSPMAVASYGGGPLPLTQGNHGGRVCNADEVSSSPNGELAAAEATSQRPHYPK